MTTTNLPDLIQNKVAYYRWRSIQSKLTKEYHKYVSDNRIDKDGGSGVLVLLGGFPTWWNNRDLLFPSGKQKIGSLTNWSCHSDIHLPKRYYYTIGHDDNVDYRLNIFD